MARRQLQHAEAVVSSDRAASISNWRSSGSSVTALPASSGSSRLVTVASNDSEVLTAAPDPSCSG